MPLTGKDLVTLIQSTLDSEARQDQLEIKNQMAAEAGPILATVGLENHSDEIFELFRSIDMANTTSRADGTLKLQKQGELERLGMFTGRLQGWGLSADLNNASFLYEELLVPYSRLRTRMFSSRSLSAHVGAVLRPFRRRYLDTWAEAGIPGFSLNAVTNKVEELSTRVVHDENELRKWAEAVYGLFSDIAVFGPNFRESGIRRPMGMIGSGSERTYKQQWFAWMKTSGPSLLGVVKDSETGKLDHALGNQRGFNQAVAPRPQDNSAEPVVNFASATMESPSQRQRRQFDEPTTASFMMPPESPALQHTTELTIRVSDSIEPTLVAERSWSDKKSAVSDVDGWVSNLIRFWGGPDRIASVQIEFKEAGNESTFPLPPLPLGQIADVIVSAITSYR